MNTHIATIENGKLAAKSVIAIDAGSTFEEALNATNIALEQLANAVIAEQLPHHLFVELIEDHYSTDVTLHIGRLNTEHSVDCGATDHVCDIADSLSQQSPEDLVETFGADLATDPGLAARLSHLFQATLFLCGPTGSKVYHPAVRALLDETKAKPIDPARAAEITRILMAVSEQCLTVEQAQASAVGSTLH